MIGLTSSSRGLLTLALAAGLALAPPAPVQGRGLQPRRQVLAAPRQPEPDLLSALWSMLTSLWGEDGSHLDPFG